MALRKAQMNSPELTTLVTRENHVYEANTASKCDILLNTVSTYYLKQNPPQEATKHSNVIELKCESVGNGPGFITDVKKDFNKVAAGGASFIGKLQPAKAWICAISTSAK